MVEAEVSADHARCIRQLVQIAVKRLKSPSNLLKEDLFTVKIVSQNIRNSSHSGRKESGNIDKFR